MLDPMKDFKYRFKVIPTTVYPPGQRRWVLLPTIQVIIPLKFQVVNLSTICLPVGYSWMRTSSVKRIILFTDSNLP
jgi:hypothetical protein